ncbi:MAG: hypothetical protein ACLT24_25110, partial [Klebsiella sp.]
KIPNDQFKEIQELTINHVPENPGIPELFSSSQKALVAHSRTLVCYSSKLPEPRQQSMSLVFLD